MAQAQSKSQFCFLQKESAFATIPNASGVATVGNGDACRIITLVTDGDAGRIDRPDKTGTNSATVGAGGRKQAQWRARMSLAASGTPGTLPDNDPLLEAAFGKAAVVSPGVSCTYALDDLSPSLAIWNFRDPATVTQEVAFGAVVQSMRIPLNQDVAEIEFNGPAFWVLDSTNFASHDTPGKGGLSAFPARPASPIFAGDMALGFLGVVTLDGGGYTTLRSGTINCDFTRELPLDVFNSYYANKPVMNIRNITVDFNLYDDDTASMGTLKQKALTKTPVTLVFQIGATPGNIWTWTLRNVLLDTAKYDDSAANYSVNFSGRAHASNAMAKDELELVIT